MLFLIVKSFLLCIGIPFAVIFLYFKFNKWYRRERVDGFHKKSVFVTGTDHGFGNLLVNKLDSMGLKVYAGCYTEKGAEELRKTSSERVKTIMIDVTKRETLKAARDFIEKDLGPNEGLWGLVNNAGAISGVVFNFSQLNDYRKCMEVNFFGVVTTTEIFLPLIKKSRGRIVTISACSSRRSIVSPTYSSTKHAIEAYSTGLRRSMQTFGVHAAVIEPGFFRTPISTVELWLSDTERTWNNLPTELKEEYGLDYKNSLLELMIKQNHNLGKLNSDKTEKVIRTITHALSSKRPKDRYCPGIDNYFLMPLFALAPDWFLDFVTKNSAVSNKIAGLNKKN